MTGQSDAAAERSFHAPPPKSDNGFGLLTEVAPRVFKLACVARLEAENAALRERVARWSALAHRGADIAEYWHREAGRPPPRPAPAGWDGLDNVR
jgi:hypothetical protein